ncbi:hypothetical protein JVT61DRAFT_11473 [Boletus reticuloceps]|uniref:Uncharacterized protein n=1 Tax=Boletus reticuloceps TaxID=495285 RepID=A0A8I2YYX8_9AGAM|nr:hypothetical protein JVT61DRAFT_11473 [Boletus reticuloceps]
MIMIEQLSKWKSPLNKNIAKTLCTRAHLSFKDFILSISETSLRPVVIDRFTWMSIMCITIEVYFCCPGGPLSIDVDPQGDFSAFGVCDHPTTK